MVGRTPTPGPGSSDDRKWFIMWPWRPAGRPGAVLLEIAIRPTADGDCSSLPVLGHESTCSVAANARDSDMRSTDAEIARHASRWTQRSVQNSTFSTPRWYFSVKFENCCALSDV